MGDSDRTRDSKPPPRRSFLGGAASVAMGGSLVASYGTFASHAARYLYPAKPDARAWMFVREVSAFPAGESLAFEAPDGSEAVIARKANTGEVSDFVALSSVCPHLGCQVHWEANADRFFCPCHNGTFDPAGKPTGGPPAQAGQSLLEFPLRIEGGLLYVEVPIERLDVVADGLSAQEGHDPCLARRSDEELA
jgi:cytochrome b6-f complex iron-sulfur subunit